MSGRELVILLLGFAIIAVVLRGLYVAIRARRGQIRMAIDKNIPQDIDLDSLELAELPGGGARVVNRSLEEVNRQNSVLDSAQQRAETLELNDEQQIPVLMDAVELSESAEPEQPDEALFDCDKQDNLASLVPDYLVEDERINDEIDDEVEPQEQYDDFDGDYEDNFEEDEPEQELSEQELPEQELPERELPERELPERELPEREELTELKEEQNISANFEDQLDNFSMTAGERIGKAPSLGGEVSQAGLFDDDEDEELQEPPKESKSVIRALFSGFGRKSASAAKGQTEPEPEPEFEAEEDEPVMEDALFMNTQGSYEESVHEEPVYEEPELTVERAPRDELAAVRFKSETQGETQEAMGDVSEVLVINVMARQGLPFQGNDLLHVLITSGLKFGDMNIFHKRLSNDSQGPIIFSVANAINPGTFDLNNMEHFSTMGISMFLALPTPVNNLDGFEQMLDVAQQIRGALDADLKDDHRNVMTAQTIEHYRQRVRDFELRRLKTAAARG